MTDIEPSKEQPSRTTSITLALQAFVAAMRQLFGQVELTAARRKQMQIDAEAQERAEAEMRRRFSEGPVDWHELEQRARNHGVKFAHCARAHHRAALLDFLDNPDAPSPLTYMHMTWIIPIDQTTGRSTFSGTHPAGRDIYRWTARHIHGMYANPHDPQDVRTVDRLKALTPLDRASWSAEQWRAHEAQETERWHAGLKFACTSPTVPADRRTSRDHRLGV